MNEKGFTLIELLVVVMILGMVTGIAVTSYNKYLQRSQDKTFRLETNNFKDAVYDAYVDYLSNRNKSNELKQLFYDLDTGESIKVTLKQLVDYDYIRKIRNPYRSKEVCDIENSSVTVTNKNTDNLTKDFEYKICLICGTHQSDGC